MNMFSKISKRLDKLENSEKQGTLGIRQWTINSCKYTMMNKITPSLGQQF